MKKLIYIGLMLLLVFSCTKKSQTNVNLNLEFTKMYEIDNWENGRTGLLWTLSFLGAELKKDSLGHAIKWIDSTKFDLDLLKVGFSEKALQALAVITDSLKKTEEYKVKNSIELGAFVSLLMGSARHYYAVTNAEEDFFEKLKQYKDQQPVIFPVPNSLISKHVRVLKMYTNGDPIDWFFIAEEGEGDVTLNTFKAKAYEVFNVMPNGQLRFSVYDSNGKLIDSSPQNLSDAGKPAKCLWCHEMFIQPLYTKNDVVSGYISPDQFQKMIRDLMFKLERYRKTLSSDLDYSKTQDHSLAERLYIGYMEPSLMKLSGEWNIPVNKLKEILKNEHTHKHPEFAFFGDIYFRDSINVFAPFKPCIQPFEIRENNAGRQAY